MKNSMKKLLPVIVVIAVIIIGWNVWKAATDKSPGDGFAGGNGRLEATEIDISAKLAGRIEAIYVDEGDFVEKGQILAKMQTNVLEAQLREAEAQRQLAVSEEIKAQAQVALRESDKAAAEAELAQRMSELDAAQRRYNRSSKLPKATVSAQEVDDDETRLNGAKAAVEAAKSQVTVTEASIEAAKADREGASYTIKAAEATVTRIQADIDDCELTAPRSGRVQYRIAQPGEVLAAGGKVLNMVDLADVYMTFFLPTEDAGKIALGAEARLFLDALPDYPVPATVSYVASTAQFTPKTVETEDEREKLMFRVKAKIDPTLLEKYITMVKVGLPGVGWVKLDPKAEWPDYMRLRSEDGRQ